MIGSFADTSVWVGPTDLCNFVRFMRLETLWAAPHGPLALLWNEKLGWQDEEASLSWSWISLIEFLFMNNEQNLD